MVSPNSGLTPCGVRMNDELRDPNLAVDYILANAGKFAAAKAQRVYLEEFRKSKKVLLMGQSDEKSAVSREQFAYSHPEYITLLEGLKAAIEVEENIRWHMTAAQLRIDIWRSQEASNRNQDKVMR